MESAHAKDEEKRIVRPGKGGCQRTGATAAVGLVAAFWRYKPGCDYNPLIHEFSPGGHAGDGGTIIHRRGRQG